MQKAKLLSGIWQAERILSDQGLLSSRPKCLLAWISKAECVFGGAVDKDGYHGEWVTMRGKPAFIRDGESSDDAIKRNFGKDKASAKTPKPKSDYPKRKEINKMGMSKLESRLTANMGSMPFESYAIHVNGTMKEPMLF